MRNMFIKCAGWLAVLFAHSSYAVEGGAQWDNGICYSGGQAPITDPVQAKLVCGDMPVQKTTTNSNGQQSAVKPVLEWNGQWYTTEWNKMSVCFTKTGEKINAGPIWDNQDAAVKCPAAIKKAATPLPASVEKSHLERCRQWIEIAAAQVATIASRDIQIWKQYARYSCSKKGFFPSYQDYRNQRVDVPYCMRLEGCAAQTGAIPTENMSPKESCLLKVRWQYSVAKNNPAINNWQKIAVSACDPDGYYTDFRTYLKGDCLDAAGMMCAPKSQPVQ